MKKLLLLTFCAVSLVRVSPVSAQYYYTAYPDAGRNPGGLNTDAEAPNQSGWNQILFGQNSMLNNPVWSPVQALPFAFNFNGAAVTHYKVSTSGVLTFDTLAVAPPPATNVALPSAQVPNKAVCVWGLGAKAGDYIYNKNFGGLGNQQHWVQFNNYSEPGNSNTVNTFWAIVLEEGSNKIYVVDQHTTYNTATPALSLTIGVQIDATTAEQLPASPGVNTTTTFSDDDTPDDNTYYAFNPGLRPAHDLALRSLAIPAIVSRQNPTPITGSLQNLGGQVVTSYTVGYRVNNGPAVTGQVSAANVASLASGTFTHPTPWLPPSSGRFALQVWLAAPNGQPDFDRNNDTLRTSVLVGDSVMRRLVVEECFTSATCPPCRPGNQVVESVNRQNAGKHVVIKYQQNFPSPGNDPYYTTETGARRGYYGINAIPYMMLDGGWNGNSNSFTSAVLNQFQSRPALARVRGTYTISGQGRVNAIAFIRPFFAAQAGRLVAQVVITERRTVRNARTNGETVFFQVAKKMLPNQNGTVLPALASGQDFRLSLPFDTNTLPATQAIEHLDSLRVVVFVQDVVTKEVYQGEYLTLSRPNATRNGKNGPSFELAPNPASGRVALTINLDRSETIQVEVLDVLGRAVLTRRMNLSAGPQEISLGLERQTAGIFTVRVSSSQGVGTNKLALE